jgi:hypothetical protein
MATPQVLSATLVAPTNSNASSPAPSATVSVDPASVRPFAGLLVIADRGNDRLLVMDANKHIIWRYPDPHLPAPPSLLYFPDDAFWVHRGHAILVNEEENHTLIEIAYPSGRVLWTYGHPRVAGAHAVHRARPIQQGTQHPLAFGHRASGLGGRQYVREGDRQRGLGRRGLGEPLPQPCAKPFPTGLGEGEYPAVGALGTRLGSTAQETVLLEPPQRLVNRGFSDLHPVAHPPGAESLEQPVPVQRLLGQQPEHDHLDLRHDHRNRPLELWSL